MNHTQREINDFVDIINESDIVEDISFIGEENKDLTEQNIKQVYQIIFSSSTDAQGRNDVLDSIEKRCLSETNLMINVIGTKTNTSIKNEVRIKIEPNY